MSADDYDFVRPLAARDFADHIGRIGVGQHVRFHLQMRHHRIARVHQALDQQRVFDGDGGGWDLRKTFGVFERAGVRRLQAEGSDRAHQRRNRAQTARLAKARWFDRPPCGCSLHKER